MLGMSLLGYKRTSSRLKLKSALPNTGHSVARAGLPVLTHNGSEDWAASLVRLGNAVAKLPPDFLGGE
jgi:hypothetical protein